MFNDIFEADSMVGRRVGLVLQRGHFMLIILFLTWRFLLLSRWGKWLGASFRVEISFYAAVL